MGNRESVFLECGLPLAALRLPFWCSTQCDSSHFATKSIANPVYPCYIGCDVQHSQFRSPHLPARPPVAFARRLPALAQEAASPRLQAGHPGSKHNISNRKTYEKLEVRVSAAKSATSLFLIARKQHFSQGTLSASRMPFRDAQFAPRLASPLPLLRFSRIIAAHRKTQRRRKT